MSGFKHISDGGLDDHRAELLDCGFPCLNEKLLLKKWTPELHVVGARPGQGKSAFMFQVAAHVAKTLPVAVFSLEMDTRSIMQRLLAAETGRGLKNIQMGLVPKGELEEGYKTLSKLSLYINDSPKMTTRHMVEEVRQLGEDAPVGLIVIDYLQKVPAANGFKSAMDSVGATIGQLKDLAKEFGVPVMVGSQLSRQSEWRAGNGGSGAPKLSDLRDSGSIEADADTVLFIHRPHMYNSLEPADLAILDVAKFRSGEVGEHRFTFLGGSTRFMEGNNKQRAQGKSPDAKVNPYPVIEQEIM